MSDIQDIAQTLGNLTITEVVSLRKMLEAEWGVSGDPAPAQPYVDKFAPAPVVEEPTEFSVWLMGSGDKKINVIKVVRQMAPLLGLKEAKELVDGAPNMILSAVTKDVATLMRFKLEEAGASVEVRPA